MLVVVVGGGSVAARKVEGLLDGGATRIRCVAPRFAEHFPQSPSVERIAESYDPRHLDGAGLVFAATGDPQVNAAIVRDAHGLRLLVNRADSDDVEPGDFSTPAIRREGELLVTVSAGGSPALAAAVRDSLCSRLDPRWSKMADAMRELRPRITGRGDLPAASRQAALRDLAGEEAMQTLEKRGVEGLWTWVKERNPTL